MGCAPQLAGLRERAARLEIERDQHGRLATAIERTRVAREMRDIVGRDLAVMITLADAGAYATDIAPERGKETHRTHSHASGPELAGGRIVPHYWNAWQPPYARLAVL